MVSEWDMQGNIRNKEPGYFTLNSLVFRQPTAPYPQWQHTPPDRSGRRPEPVHNGGVQSTPAGGGSEEPEGAEDGTHVQCRCILRGGQGHGPSIALDGVLGREEGGEGISKCLAGRRTAPVPHGVLWATRVVTGLGHKSSHSLAPWFEPRKGEDPAMLQALPSGVPPGGDGAADTTRASAPAG